MSLGEGEARSLGTDIKKTRGLVIICATALTASAVCISGTIGWIGSCNSTFGKNNHRSGQQKADTGIGSAGPGFLLLIDTAANIFTERGTSSQHFDRTCGSAVLFLFTCKTEDEVA